MAAMSETLVLPGFLFGGDVQSRPSAFRPVVRTAQAESRTSPRATPAAPSLPSPEAASPTQGSAPAAQSEATGFTVDQYIVEGNSLLLREQIEAALAKHKRKGM